ncbi:MAG: hydrogenase maturation protease [Acidimicrobiales bacterium]
MLDARNRPDAVADRVARGGREAGRRGQPLTRAGILIVGFGNPLRGDDGVGWRIADALRGDHRLVGAEILVRHQLTPELAEDVASAELVVLVDARDDGSSPGTVSISHLDGRASGTDVDHAALQSHAFDPAGLLDLSAELFGPVPPVVLVTVSVANDDVGERLSPHVERALPAAVAAVVQVIERHRFPDSRGCRP